MIHCDDENIRKLYIIAILTWFSPLSKCAHTVSQIEESKVVNS